MAGFGDKLLVHLGTVPHASTDDLAKLAGVTLEQAYSRLMALSYEKRVRSAGKGKNRAWSLPGDAPIEAVVVPVVAPIADRRNHGWKPDLKMFEPFNEGDALELKDKLLVEYPEEWRHSMLCTVVKLPGYRASEPNIAQVWNLREDCFSVVDVATFVARGWKIARIEGERDVAKLAEEG